MSMLDVAFVFAGVMLLVTSITVTLRLWHRDPPTHWLDEVEEQELIERIVVDIMAGQRRKAQQTRLARPEVKLVSFESRRIH